MMAQHLGPMWQVIWVATMLSQHLVNDANAEPISNQCRMLSRRQQYKGLRFTFYSH